MNSSKAQDPVNSMRIATEHHFIFMLRLSLCTDYYIVGLFLKQLV